MKWVLSLVFALVLTSPALRAQDDFWVAGAIGSHFTFNFDDVFWAFGGGVDAPDIGASLMADFSFRPGRKRVWVETGTNTFDQYREKRYLLSLSAEKRFTLKELEGSDLRLQLFGMLRGSLSFGNYGGTGYKPPKGFVFNPAAGVSLQAEAVILRLGYNYLPLQTASIPDHRIFIGFTGLIF